MLGTINIPSTLLRAAGILVCAALGCITACRPNKPTSILLFNGAGTSPSDVAALENILRSHHFNYSMVDSPQLNAMSESQLLGYRLLVVPGGNFVEMGKSLTPGTPGNIRGAVASGLNYLGICAGAFLAGNSPINGLNLTNGISFPFYSAEGQGIRKAALWIQAAGEPPLQHYWEDGPALTGWGDVVGMYPDGTAAIVEANVGAGWVILLGIHPEAPESWRRGMEFRTPARIDTAYMVTLIDAALQRTRLAHF